MEIVDKQDKGYISVWLTNEEQKHYDLNRLTTRLLQNVRNKKCKVIFYLSGHDDLFRNTEGLLLANLRNV